MPFAIGLTGLLAYIQLIMLGARATSQACVVDPRPCPCGGATGRGDILY